MTIDFKDLLQVELRPDVAYALELDRTLSPEQLQDLQESWRAYTDNGTGQAPRLIVLPPGFRLAKARMVDPIEVDALITVPIDKQAS